MNQPSSGFTMVELMVTIVVMGLVLAFAVPAFTNLTQSQQLKGAAENVAGQLRLSRAKAIATGVDQPMHFTYNWSGCNCDYHIHYASGVGATFSLPKGVSYANGVGAISQLTMKADGTMSTSGIVVLKNLRGNLDTLSVQQSGLVLVQ